MKRVDREFRVLVDGKSREKILGRPTVFIDMKKRGIYEHNGKYYAYLVSDYYVDYFEEISEPPKEGVFISRGKKEKSASGIKSLKRRKNEYKKD